MSFTFLVTFFVFITRSFINILEFIKQQSFQVYLLDHHHSGVGCLGLTGALCSFWAWQRGSTENVGLVFHVNPVKFEEIEWDLLPQ